MNILTIAVQTKGHGAYGRQRRMADALIKKGHKVFWMAPGLDYPGDETFIKIDVSKLPLPTPIKWQISLRNTFRKQEELLKDIDIVFTVREYDAFACVLNKLLAFKPVIFFSRGDTIECEKFNFRHPVRIKDFFLRPLTILIYKPLQRWLFPRVSRVIFQANFLRDKAANRFPGISFRTSVLPNDCTIRWVHEDTDQAGQEKLGQYKKPGKLLVGMVAPMYWHGKGAKVLLEALKEFNAPDKFEVVIVGYGPDEIKVKNFIKKNKLEINVHFVGRIQGMNRHMGIFDLLIVPTKMYDACPNVVLEAINKEVAIIASDIPAHENLLGRHKSILFKNTDASDLAIKLGEVVLNPELLTDIREIIKKRRKLFDFDWDAKLVELIESEPPEAMQ